MTTLKKSGIISQNRFSFYVPSYGIQSYTDFGPANLNAVRTGETFVSIPISNDSYYGAFWSATIDAFRFPGISSTEIYTF